jgi:hypothetical protein
LTPAEMLDCLLDLAREAGIALRPLSARGAAEGDLPVRSGVCRVRGQLLVMLAASDSVEDRIDVLLHALRSAGPAVLEGRWIPPAVRERLEGPGGG